MIKELIRCKIIKGLLYFPTFKTISEADNIYDPEKKEHKNQLNFINNHRENKEKENL